MIQIAKPMKVTRHSNEELKKGTVLNTNTSSTQFQNMIYLVL